MFESERCLKLVIRNEKNGFVTKKRSKEQRMINCGLNFDEFSEIVEESCR